MTEQLNPNCPRCDKPGKLIPAGVSANTGQPYDAFMSCAADCRNGDRSLTWKSSKQFKYHRDMAIKAERRAAEKPARAPAATREKAIVKATKPAPKRAPAARKPRPAPAPRPPSDAVVHIVLANRCIEALNALDPQARTDLLGKYGYEPKVAKSYVLFVNALGPAYLSELAGALGVPKDIA